MIKINLTYIQFIVYTIHTKQSDPSPLLPILKTWIAVGSLIRRQKMGHNYPSNRKSNPDSATQILISVVGERKLYKIWSELGMYKASSKLSIELNWYVSPYVLRYLSNKFNWSRDLTNKNLPLYQGVLRGKVKAEYYKHIKFQ